MTKNAGCNYRGIKLSNNKYYPPKYPPPHDCCSLTHYKNATVHWIAKEYVHVDLEECCVVCGKLKQKKRVTYYVRDKS